MYCYQMTRIILLRIFVVDPFYNNILQNTLNNTRIMGETLSCTGCSSKNNTKDTVNGCSLPESSIKIGDSYNLCKLIPPKIFTIGFEEEVIQSKLVHAGPHCVHGLWTSKEQPHVMLLAVGPPTCGVLRLDVDGERPHVHQILSGKTSLEQIAVMQMKDKRLILLEWTHGQLPPRPGEPPHIITRRVRVTVFTQDDSDSEFPSSVVENGRLEFDDDEARDCAFLHQLSDNHVLAACRSSNVVHFLALSSDNKIEEFDTDEWPMPLRSMAITRDEIGRNLAAVCLASENPTFRNKIYIFLVNDDSGYKAIIEISKLTLECPLELLWLNSRTIAAWSNLEQYKRHSLIVISREENNNLKIEKHGMVENKFKINLWALHQNEQLVAYDADANTLTLLKIN